MRVYNRKSQVEFQAWVRGFFEDQVMEKLMVKGEQYSGDTIPAMTNFIDGAKIVHQTPQAHLMGLGTKHWLALASWAARCTILTSGEPSGPDDKEAETAIERASDILIYMFLLIFWLSGETKGGTE